VTGVQTCALPISNVLKDDLVEAVIGLASNLFFGTSIPAAVLVVNKDKPAERKGKVLFIEASAEFQEGKNQNCLRQKDIEKIVTAYREYKDVEKFCRVVSMKEIAENDYNLNITRYVDTTPEEEVVDVAAVARELQDLRERRAGIEAEMDRYLEELGYSGRSA
jgi:type I restriction enzyme M protein